jgi:hypothetical protein
VSTQHPIDEVRIARWLSQLPAAPQGWVRAAELLPFARRDLDSLVRDCETDAVLRAHVLAGLESALRSAHEPTRRDAAALRDRLAGE